MAAPTFAPRPSNPSSEGPRGAIVTLATSNRGIAALTVRPSEPAPDVADCHAKREFHECHDRRCPVRAFFGAISTIVAPRWNQATWTMIVASATNVAGLSKVKDGFAALGTAVVMVGGAAEAVGLAASAHCRHIAGALVIHGSRLAAQMPGLT